MRTAELPRRNMFQDHWRGGSMGGQSAPPPIADFGEPFDSARRGGVLRLQGWPEPVVHELLVIALGLPHLDHDQLVCGESGDGAQQAVRPVTGAGAGVETHVTVDLVVQIERSLGGELQDENLCHSVPPLPGSLVLPARRSGSRQIIYSGLYFWI